MSLDIVLKQQGLFKKKLSFDEVKACIPTPYNYGIGNDVFVLQDLNEKDYLDKYIIFYNPQKIGRGFQIFLGKNTKDIKLILNLPCTRKDVKFFYETVHSLCLKLNIKEFEQDGTIIKLNDLVTLQQDFMKDNDRYIVQIMEGECMTIFGATYPVHIERSFMDSIASYDVNEVAIAYEDYLDKKQRGDYYYARPLVYQKKKTDAMFAIYALSEDVDSIVALTPELPIYAKMKVDEWYVNLVIEDGDDYKPSGIVPFDVFKEQVKLEALPHFDESHVIFKLDKEMITRLLAFTVEIE